MATQTETTPSVSPRLALLSDTDLDSTPEGSKTRLDNLILGGAFHDIYHAGQIQLLKRLQGIGARPAEG